MNKKLLVMALALLSCGVEVGAMMNEESCPGGVCSLERGATQGNPIQQFAARKAQARATGAPLAGGRMRGQVSGTPGNPSQVVSPSANVRAVNTGARTRVSATVTGPRRRAAAQTGALTYVAARRGRSANFGRRRPGVLGAAGRATTGVGRTGRRVAGAVVLGRGGFGRGNTSFRGDRSTTRFGARGVRRGGSQRMTSGRRSSKQGFGNTRRSAAAGGSRRGTAGARIS